MDKKKTLQMIADITNAPGTSGFEDAVVATARGYGEPYADLKEDSLRNLAHEVGGLACDDAGNILAFGVLDEDLVGGHVAGHPAAQGNEVDGAVGVDVVDHEAQLVAVAAWAAVPSSAPWRPSPARS